MPNIGPAEILVILVVALLVFGPKKLPEIGRQVGQAMRELRRVQASLRDEVRDVLEPMSPGGVPPKLPRPAEPGAEATADDADDTDHADATGTGATGTTDDARGEAGASGPAPG